MAQAQPLLSDQERRRQTRRATLCRAYVHTPAGKWGVADMRECSDAGVYLEFLDLPEEAVRAQLASANVTLELVPTNRSQAVTQGSSGR